MKERNRLHEILYVLISSVLLTAMFYAYKVVDNVVLEIVLPLLIIITCLLACLIGIELVRE